MKEFYRLVEIMDVLRGENGCPWDKKQTMETLKLTFLEETYEVLEAMENIDDELCSELGDLLLHIVFQAKIAKEEGKFDIDDVARKVNEKLIRRHPHIFSDVKVEDAEDVARNWEEIKRGEKEHQNRKSILDGIPKGMPELLKAHKIQKKVGAYGFEWEHLEEVYDKIEEELREVQEAVKNKDRENLEEEIGDLLFSVVNYSRRLDINPSEALRKTNEKFTKRFNYIEENCDIKTANLEEMDALWEKSKKIKK